ADPSIALVTFHCSIDRVPIEGLQKAQETIRLKWHGRLQIKSRNSILCQITWRCLPCTTPNKQKSRTLVSFRWDDTEFWALRWA
ncbi:hypothetical protein, partial [Devosia insulae]|uniref:hypothetical protein n=1 Tax=Devosia insulae TaxID=408174 RepID=UPI001AEC9061